MTVFWGQATDTNAGPPFRNQATSSPDRSQGIRRTIAHSRAAKGASVLDPGSPLTPIAVAIGLPRNLGQGVGAGHSGGPQPPQLADDLFRGVAHSGRVVLPHLVHHSWPSRALSRQLEQFMGGKSISDRDRGLRRCNLPICLNMHGLSFGLVVEPCSHVWRLRARPNPSESRAAGARAGLMVHALMRPSANVASPARGPATAAPVCE